MKKKSNLKILRFGTSYNTTINETVLPDTITELFFGYKYNKSIGTNILPHNLKNFRH